MLVFQLGILGYGLIQQLLYETEKRKKKEVRLCVLGLDNAGKTTILKALANQDLQTVMPTQGFNMQTLTVGNLIFNAWDLGG